jgi:hypothetical protein
MAASYSIADCPPFPVISGVEIRHCPSHIGYSAGDDGSVWNCRPLSGRGMLAKEWRQMTILLRTNGRPYVTVDRKKVLVYRLVLEAFKGPCPLDMEACHDPDPNPLNCRLNNLRWDIHKANSRDMVRHGNCYFVNHPEVVPHPTGKDHHRGSAKLTKDDVIRIRELAKTARIKDLAVMYSVHRMTISKIVNRRLDWTWI